MTTDRQWIIGCGFNDRHGEAMSGEVDGFFDLRGDITGGHACWTDSEPVLLDWCAVCDEVKVDPACDLGICPGCVTRLRR